MGLITKVLIVDDSSVARDFLAFIIESDPELKVIGKAANGEEALELLKHQTPDIIMLDIVMPKMDGFELTKRIMQSHPIPIIVVSGVYNREEVCKSFKAIEAGAVAILEKPKGIGDSRYQDVARFVIETIKVMAKIKPHGAQNLNSAQSPYDIKKSQETPTPAHHAETKHEHVPNIEAIAIGASIGGPQALSTILSALPQDFPCPIFLVQSICSGFIQGFIDWLNGYSSLKVTLAKDGQHAIPGYVYVAPSNVQMEVLNGNMIKLVSDPAETRIAPSIGHLFQSVSQTYGPHSIGIILSGLGSDGAKELLRMKEKGAITIAQNEESCVTFDLPKSAVHLGAANKIENPQQISLSLKSLVSQKHHNLI